MTISLAFDTEQGARNEVDLPWWLYDLLDDQTEERKFWITKGLGAGGTFGLAIWHYTMCLINRRSKFSWSIAPTYQQVADTLIPTFTEVLTSVFRLQENQDYSVIAVHQPKIRLHRTGQEIHFKSANRPERMVGASVSHISGTECGLWPRMAFEKSDARLRCPKAERRQYLGEGTPEGMNWWEKEANLPTEIDEKRNYRRVILHTSDNTHLRSGYVDKLKQTYSYDPAKLESYLYGVFIPFTKSTAYWDFAASRHVTLDIVNTPSLPIMLCCDFNASPLAWCAMQQQIVSKRYGERVPTFMVTWETSGKSRGIMDSCAEFIAAFPPDQYADTPIQIYGDPSGYFKSHKSPSCDYDQIVQYLRPYYRQITISASRAAPQVRVRLERVNALFAYGRILVAAWCRNTIRSLSQTALKEGTWDIEKKTDETISHWADAIGYPLFQLTKADDLGKPNNKKIYGING